jgi:DNA-binding NtrC family response regulator
MEEFLSVNSFEGLVGATPEMRKVFEDSRKIAETRVPVLIIGEFGTGKRSIAMSIHKLSGGEEKHFMVLADYGEEKKTSPVDIKAGMKLLEKEDAGTLYVEEIANLSLGEQFELEEYLKSSGPANKGPISAIRKWLHSADHGLAL